MTSTTVSFRRSRKRSTLACQSCHQRKVRCNVTQSGPPCINCLGDGVKCEIVPRGRGRGRNNLVRILDQRQSSDAGPNSPVQQTSSLNQSPLASESLSIIVEPSPEPPIAPTTLPHQHQEQEDAHQNPEPPASIASHTRAEDHCESEPKTGNMPDEGDSAGFVAILDDEEPDEETMCIYTGDPQGLGLVVDICQPHRSLRGNHFMVPRAAANSALLPVDLAALHAKNCFTLPSAIVRKKLLRCYFQHVHPFLPILEVTTFITQYESGGPQQVNLLLLWSMFFASTNFLDHDTVALAGYSSRKAMKRSLYQRAKALYDADYEKDKIPLIQSVLLLAFWYADSDDRDGSWHWIGIAISLCQTIGLHRSPARERATFGNSYGWKRKGVPEEKLRLWRLIWWMCYFRDTWLSFGLGRPPRINLADCDMPMPTVVDFQGLSAGLAPGYAKDYLPEDEHRTLPVLWSCLLDTTLGLGNILKNHYRPQPPADGRPVEEIIDQDRKWLLQCRARFPSEEFCESPVVLSHLYHLYIYHESCQIALHRSYMAGKPGQLTGTAEEGWRVRALQRAKIAASNIDGVLSKMAASGMMATCQPMIVTAMIPPLQIHLLEFVSNDPVAKRLGRHRLDILMIFLRQLQSTYWAADFIYNLFHRAIDVLDSRKSQPSASTGAAPRQSTQMGSASSLIDPRLQTPMTPPSQPSEQSESVDGCSLVTPKSTAATPQDVEFEGLNLQLPDDINLALAYDILPFQFDIESTTENFTAFDPNLPFLNKQGEDSLNFCLSDRDLSLLFDGDHAMDLSSRD